MPDILVAGGGPAGAVAALILARRGYPVRLADPLTPPAPRIESLAASALPLAADLGILPVLEAACLGRAAAMELDWRDRPERRTFETDAPWLLSRAALHRGLRDAAAAAGARIVAQRVARPAPGALR
ncbi:FAD-dependent monooxygenase, partial [Mangrovicoccus algicola]|nr:hypothetical protein [Mangrovicoccus algicola]